jgi:hypothetical protein
VEIHPAGQAEALAEADRLMTGDSAWSFGDGDGFDAEIG